MACVLHPQLLCDNSTHIYPLSSATVHLKKLPRLSQRPTTVGHPAVSNGFPCVHTIVFRPLFSFFFWYCYLLLLRERGATSVLRCAQRCGSRIKKKSCYHANETIALSTIHYANGFTCFRYSVCVSLWCWIRSHLSGEPVAPNIL